MLRCCCSCPTATRASSSLSLVARSFSPSRSPSASSSSPLCPASAPTLRQSHPLGPRHHHQHQDQQQRRAFSDEQLFRTQHGQIRVNLVRSLSLSHPWPRLNPVSLSLTPAEGKGRSRRGTVQRRATVRACLPPLSLLTATRLTRLDPQLPGRRLRRAVPRPPAVGPQVERRRRPTRHGLGSADARRVRRRGTRTRSGGRRGRREAAPGGLLWRL